MSQLIGQFFQLVSITVLVYATLQTFFHPWIEKDSPLQAFFLPRGFFNVVPIIAVALLVLLSGGYLYKKTMKKKSQ